MVFKFNRNVMMGDAEIVQFGIYEDGTLKSLDPNDYKVYHLDDGRVTEEKDYAEEFQRKLQQKQFILSEMLPKLHREIPDYVEEAPYYVEQLIMNFFTRKVDGKEIIQHLKASGLNVPKGLKITRLHLGGWSIEWDKVEINIDEFLSIIISAQDQV